MIAKLREHSLFTLFYLFSFTLLGMEARELDIRLGPLLHFEGSSVSDYTWAVSALYLLASAESHPDLIFAESHKEEIVKAEVLATKFGYDFVKYNMTSHQGFLAKGIDYALEGEKGSHRFYIPAIGQPSNILYHSCNGYQREADRKSVGGITPMWDEINRRHELLPYVLQLGGGDQLYADGLIKNPNEDFSEPRWKKTFGVFALPAIKSWLKGGKEFYKEPFTPEGIEQTDRFYFDHYIRQYNEAGFKKTTASVPILSTIDDHDLYDGCGSYPEYLQQCSVMKGIRSIASWYAYTIQHQVNADKMIADRQGYELPSYHFIHTFNEGKLSILGVDTRTDRTLYQITSQESWDKIFNALEKLGPECKHLIVMLGSPVVYASSKTLDKAVIIAENEPIIDAVMSMKNDVKNAFHLYELADDGQDQWSHKNHEEELDDMILRLQAFAQKHDIRVTIVSGDVHLGGAGKIYSKEIGFEDRTSRAIWQIISSPVGNIPVNNQVSKLLGKKAQQERDLKNNCTMRTFKLQNKETNKKGPSLIARRNFLSFKLLPNDELYFEWSAETRKDKPHKLYELTVPPL